MTWAESWKGLQHEPERQLRLEDDSGMCDTGPCLCTPARLEVPAVSSCLTTTANSARVSLVLGLSWRSFCRYGPVDRFLPRALFDVGCGAMKPRSHR